MSLYLRSSLAALSQGDRKCMSFLDESHKVLKGIHVLCHYNISYVIGQQFIPNQDINRHVLRGFPIDLSMLFYSRRKGDDPIMGYMLAFILFIACFLFGMTWLRTGLFNLASDNIRRWLHYLTHTPFRGVLTGTVLTALIHSSSAVMVLTVGLASSGMIPFRQTIGIMLGSNIGTTFTLEMFTLNLNMLIIPAAVVGTILLLFGSTNGRSLGMTLVGFSLIFTAIMGIQRLAEPLTHHPAVKGYMENMDRHLFLALLVGCFLTAIIQSSTVVTGVAMGFLAAGSIGIDTGIAVMLGSNVGTCITAIMASFGGGREAKLTAYAHVWLNVIGVGLFIPFIPLLTRGVQALASAGDMQLAHASVIFNLVCSLMVLPFASGFARFVERIHGPKG